MKCYQFDLLSKRRVSLSTVGTLQRLKTGGRWFRSLACPKVCPRTDDSYCDRTYSSLTVVHCFDKCNVGKQPVSWKGNTG